jgi:hypothetical protein
MDMALFLISLSLNFAVPPRPWSLTVLSPGWGVVDALEESGRFLF